MTLQPSELMKLFLCIALASYFRGASWERMGNPLFLIPPAIAVASSATQITGSSVSGCASVTYSMRASGSSAMT